MSYRARYEIEVRHPGLNKYRHIVGSDRYVVEQKARTQLAAWEEQWRAKSYALIKREEKEAQKTLALEKTEEAEASIRDAQSLLHDTLSIHDAIDFDSLKDNREFAEPEPSEPAQPRYPREPRKSDAEFRASLAFLDRLFPSRRRKNESDANRRFDLATENWKNECAKLRKSYGLQFEEYQTLRSTWQIKRAEFYEEQNHQHLSVDNLKTKYLSCEPDAIEEYCDMALARSKYPDWCPQEFDISYSETTHVAIIDYKLPSLSNLPRVKEVKYIAGRNALEEKLLKESDVNALYDSVVYQICLRTIHELYEADEIEAIRAIVFNGWVEFTDPSSGTDTRACIISVQAERSTFETLNLAQVNPKACFRALKGVGSAKLHGMVAVPPLARINREDPRFVESVSVADKLHEGTNIAAIGWDEFEHLVREVFEKLFSKDGGEVKVTRASRDGGVDAVAFDPDPIRGGKIIIQAKRYTGTVGVSAVRDLYGTVMNEGAIKGILVTTASFGPDAYAFAKDKPLSLLDGGNLLHLLQQHGHKAYINLKEAKEMNARR